MLSSRLRTFVLVAGIVGPAWAVSGGPVPAPRGGAAVAGRETDRPLAELPAHVPAKDGEVTLFADFDRRRAFGNVAVYLVNRTGRAVPLAAQDRDIYLKLEYEAAPGQWRRAQPHRDPWCASSHRTETLAAGTFRVLAGYAPTEGDRATVRSRQLHHHELAIDR